MSFRTIDKQAYGRIGELDTPTGTIETPAFLPVLGLIGGTTTKSGGIWRYTRDCLFQDDDLQAVMFQAMSFLNYEVSPESLDKWRKQTLHEWYKESEGPEFTKPVFIDSGGFRLMNSDTFGEPPEEGGTENDWGIYTDPESILGLQIDFGADIIATLDYPIPQELNRKETTERMRKSIDSAIECLRLLEEKNPKKDPSVYVAIHGHNYEDINWYVSQFLEKADSIDKSFEGFAVGSLVPLRTQGRIDILVDIIQGAKDAIPEKKRENIALHVFGVSGELCPLLSLLGVDSFDSSTYIQAARNKYLFNPETWTRKKVKDINGSWSCNCIACRNIDFDEMKQNLYSEESYEKIEVNNKKKFKSEFYADIAYHNFRAGVNKMMEIRDAIKHDRLLEYVVKTAKRDKLVKKGIKRAQLRNQELRDRLEEKGHNKLLAGPEINTFQSKIPSFMDGITEEVRKKRTLSLKYGPSDFNILNKQNYSPSSDCSILLILPCSQRKPYSESRTHRAITDSLNEYLDDIYKISISGLYGPVPEKYEEEDPVERYEYILDKQDKKQIELVTHRLYKYLEKYGDNFEYIFGYVTSKTYRKVVEEAFERYSRGEVYPKNHRSLQLTEFFKGENIQELVDKLDEINN